MLPGGRAVLFTILASNKPPQVAAYVFQTGETRSLFEGVGARFVGSGHVVFGRQGKLWAVGFDGALLHTLGAPRPLREDVVWSVNGYPQFALDAGLLAYVRAGQGFEGRGKSKPVWLDRQGTKHILPIEANFLLLPRWSPKGDRLVVQVGASKDLWTYELRRGTWNRLTSDRIIAYSAPAWSPDGSRILFVTWFDGELGLGWLPADGSGPVEVLVKGAGMRSFERTGPVMLPDGSGVILNGLTGMASVEDLLFVPLAGNRRLEPLFQAPGVERNPAIPPSGRFIAYDSDESRRAEIYVRPYPNVASRKWQISTDGGTGPVWTRGGNEIVYLDAHGQMMAVSVGQTGTDELDFSRPELLFDSGLGPDALDRDWDVSADGQRFLFLDAETRTDRTLELTLVQNWVDELKRLVPRERR